MDSEELGRRFPGHDWPAAPARYNIAPSQPVPAILAGASPVLADLHWGITLPRSGPGERTRQLINVRSETALKAGWFQRLLETRRVILPASHFYEWQVMKGGPKLPMMIGPARGRILAFAGLRGSWPNPTTGEIEWAVTILTCAPNGVMAPIHNRMPVILAPGLEQLWLDSHSALADLVPLIGPCPEEQLEARAISSLVNDVRNEGPELILPLGE